MIFSYACRSIRRHFLIFVLRLLILCLAFYIMDQTVSRDGMYRYYLENSRSLYRYDPDTSGRIATMLMGPDAAANAKIYRSFLERVEGLDGLRHFGMYTAPGGFEIIRDDEEGEGNPTGPLQGMLVAGNLWDMVPLKLTEGSLDPVFTWPEDPDTVHPVIVGSSLGEKLPPGSRFTARNMEDFPCEVCGVLDEDAVWLAGNTVFSGLSELTPLKDMVLIPVEAEACGIYTLSNLFASRCCIYETGTVDTFVALSGEIAKIRKETGFISSGQSVRELLEERERFLQEALGENRYLAGMLLLITGSYMLVSFYLSTLEQRREKGILLSVGFSRTRIALCGFLETSMQVFPALGMACLAKEAEYRSAGWESWSRGLLYSHHFRTLPFLFAFALFLAAAHAVIVLLQSGKNSITELMKLDME